MEQTEKLQKILSRSGIASRRAVEKIITEGRVSVNGRVSKLGDRASVKDVIRVDGRIIKVEAVREIQCRVLVYHKPEGEVCTRSDPEGRPSVFDRLPSINNGRWLNVGRLDLNTTGLLLFTNDGELAHRLMHPSHELEREYAVRVFGELTLDMINIMKSGIELEGQMCKFDTVNPMPGATEGLNHWYSVVLHEGHNREVRRMFEYFELKVSRLIRIRYGDIKLERSLPRGGWKELGINDINYLRSLVEMPRQRTDINKGVIEKEDSHSKYKKSSEIRKAVRRHNERREEQKRDNHFGRSENTRYSRDGENRSSRGKDNHSVRDRNSNYRGKDSRSFSRGEKSNGSYRRSSGR